jgi:alkenylglycerophosphocholine hydrolase
MDKTEKIDLIFNVLFYSAVAAFLALFIPFHPYPLSYVLKALPLFSLLVLTIRNSCGTLRVLLAASLFLSMCGDVVLDINRSLLFIPGLGCFLLAHILYVVIFLKRFTFSGTALFGSLAVLAYSTVLAVLLAGIEKNFVVPVMAYLVVITVMTISAFFYRNKNHAKLSTYALLTVGALLFLFSDTIIAVNKFIQPIPKSLMFSLPCYFGGQFCIAKALLKANKAKAE